MVKLQIQQIGYREGDCVREEWREEEESKIEETGEERRYLKTFGQGKETSGRKEVRWASPIDSKVTTAGVKARGNSDVGKDNVTEIKCQFLRQDCYKRMLFIE